MNRDAAKRERCLSVRQLAAYWGVAPRKVRAMIRRRLIDAFDIGSGRQQLRISPEAIHACEQRLSVKPAPKRRRRRVDVAPDIEALLLE